MYIRTKDEILKVLNADYMCGVKVYHTEKGMITEKQVLKESDTIEELCDEFVIVNGKIHQTTKAFNKIIEYFNPYDTLYGAIWTDKGLIYVAKMKADGNLELL